jgi:hypothetical protein
MSMTLKVVQGLVTARSLHAQVSQVNVAARSTPQGNAGVFTTGGVAGTEATLATIRSSRSGSPPDKLRDAEKAEQVARDVADEIIAEDEAALGIHQTLDSYGARESLMD